jgi:hypothetical protein
VHFASAVMVDVSPRLSHASRMRRRHAVRDVEKLLVWLEKPKCSG